MMLIPLNKLIKLSHGVWCLTRVVVYRARRGVNSSRNSRRDVWLQRKCHRKLFHPSWFQPAHTQFAVRVSINQYRLALLLSQSDCRPQAFSLDQSYNSERVRVGNFTNNISISLEAHGNLAMFFFNVKFVVNLMYNFWLHRRAIPTSNSWPSGRELSI